MINNRLKIRIVLLTLVSTMIAVSCSQPLKNNDSEYNNSVQTNDASSIVINDNTNKADDKKGEEQTDDRYKSEDNKILETFLDENKIITNQDSIEAVVNKERNLSEDYAPVDLVSITDVPTCLANPEINQLREVAANALTAMFEAAMEEINIQLYARSGYRSYNTQVSLYNGYVKNHGQEEADKFSAKPGQSEHQTGLAMDITSDSVNLQLDESFGDTQEGKWVSENAHRFGFIVRYQQDKEDITGYMYEPWHVRYVGEELAAEVFNSGKTLEEYLFEE